MIPTKELIELAHGRASGIVREAVKDLTYLADGIWECYEDPKAALLVYDMAKRLQAASASFAEVPEEIPLPANYMGWLLNEYPYYLQHSVHGVDDIGLVTPFKESYVADGDFHFPALG